MPPPYPPPGYRGRGRRTARPMISRMAVEESRVTALNDVNPVVGDYVLYWMQASQRTRHNPALERAAARANQLSLPLVVCFGLMDDYPEANARHYAFMLQGLADVHAGLAKRGIRFVVRHGRPPEVALHYARGAAMVVCDRGYLRHQKQWRDAVADGANCRVEQVEGDVVVPVEEASDKAEFAARTIRPKILRLWEQYLQNLPPVKVRLSGDALGVSGNLNPSDPQKLLSELKLDDSVKPVSQFEGGEMEARRRLRHFIRHKLTGYDEGRNEPSADWTSTMSPYLHFGHISPVDIALQVREADAPSGDRDAYLEELVVRRELGMNYVHYTPTYDSFESIPRWARATLNSHGKDKREYIYTREDLESARTHDPYWNAAQKEMVLSGFMHNYMRMYWGKKVLEWKPTAQEAFQDLLYLNNKYFICGRDPVSYSNVAWIFGLHDRPWQQRRIFGTVRYMNAAGLARKFDMDAYVQKVDALQGAQ
jgi:deoxyribodipyrimidine photo-lyase